MNYIKHLNGFFCRLEKDDKMSPYHISLYLAIFQLWNLNRFKNPFSINRIEMMNLSRIGSVNTYARCIRQLNDWGYIIYSSSANWHSGSHISCIRFDIATDTGTDTASDTLYINNTNIKKLKNHKSLTNGKGQKINGKNPLHANTDKDYSEPL